MMKAILFAWAAVNDPATAALVVGIVGVIITGLWLAGRT
jgi:hypothetical protein